MVTSTAIQAQEWVQLVPSEGKFRVMMPGTPTHQSSGHGTLVGDIVQHVYTYRDGDWIFTAAYTDVPGLGVVMAGRETLYNKTRDALLEDAKGRELSYTKFDYDGRAGRELTYEGKGEGDSPDFKGTARMLLVRTRLYILNVSMPASATPASVERFLDSFKLR